jgi:hypothetical protein
MLLTNVLSADVCVWHLPKSMYRIFVNVAQERSILSQKKHHTLAVRDGEQRIGRHTIFLQNYG